MGHTKFAYRWVPLKPDFFGAWKSVRLKHYPAYPIIIISLIIQRNLATKIRAKQECLTAVRLKQDPPVLTVGQLQLLADKSETCSWTHFLGMFTKHTPKMGRNTIPRDHLRGDMFCKTKILIKMDQYTKIWTTPVEVTYRVVSQNVSTKKTICYPIWGYIQYMVFPEVFDSCYY